jgi:hypothetical protein
MVADGESRIFSSTSIDVSVLIIYLGTFASLTLFLIPFRDLIGIVEVNAFRIVITIVLSLFGLWLSFRSKVSKINFEDLFLFLFIVLLFSSVIWSGYKFETIRNTVNYFLFYALYFVVSKSIISLKDLSYIDIIVRRVIRLFSIVATFITVVVIIHAGWRLRGDVEPLVRANSLAYLNLFALPFVIFLSNYSIGSLTRSIWSICAVFLSFAIFLTESRGAIVALIILLIIIAFSRYRRLLKPILVASFFTISITLPIFILIDISLFFSIYDRVVLGIIRLITSIFSGNYDIIISEVGKRRFAMYEYFINTFSQNYLIGVGFGVEKSAMSKSLGQKSLIVHGDPFRILLGVGVLGFGLYMLFWTKLLLTIIREAIFWFRKKDDLSDLLFLVFSSLISIHAYSFTNPVIYLPTIWFIAGFVVGLYSFYKRYHFII